MIKTFDLRKALLLTAASLGDSPVQLHEACKGTLAAICELAIIDAAIERQTDYRDISRSQADMIVNLEQRLEAAELLRGMEQDENFDSLVHLMGLNAAAAESTLSNYTEEMIRTDFDPVKQCRKFAETLRLIGTQSKRVYEAHKRATTEESDADNQEQTQPAQS